MIAPSRPHNRKLITAAAVAGCIVLASQGCYEKVVGASGFGAQGVSIVETVVNHRPRQHGQSKYGISRTIRVMLDLLTLKFLLSYSTRPLQIFGLIGFVLGLLGTIISGWLAYERLRGAESLSNRPLLLLGILLISTGFQLVTLGLLAELQARTYRESTNKPTYAIREIRESLSADVRASETFR